MFLFGGFLGVYVQVEDKLGRIAVLVYACVAVLVLEAVLNTVLVVLAVAADVVVACQNTACGNKVAVLVVKHFGVLAAVVDSRPVAVNHLFDYVVHGDVAAAGTLAVVGHGEQQRCGDGVTRTNGDTLLGVIVVSGLVEGDDGVVYVLCVQADKVTLRNDILGVVDRVGCLSFFAFFFFRSCMGTNNYKAERPPTYCVDVDGFFGCIACLLILVFGNFTTVTARFEVLNFHLVRLFLKFTVCGNKVCTAKQSADVGFGSKPCGYFEFAEVQREVAGKRPQGVVRCDFCVECGLIHRNGSRILGKCHCRNAEHSDKNCQCQNQTDILFHDIPPKDNKLSICVLGRKIVWYPTYCTILQFICRLVNGLPKK